jgi:GNAT superfamily N-acetyltransferase
MAATGASGLQASHGCRECALSAFDAGFTANAVLRDGTAIRIRPLRPDDKERLRAAFDRLSPSTIYSRFLHPVTALTPRAIEQLTELDFRDHVALTATVADERGEEMIALGRFVRLAGDNRRAELAFTVADAYQHRGVATLLLKQLIRLARPRGIRELVAHMLEDNASMAAVLRNSGLPLRQTCADGVRSVVLSLDP